MRKIGIIVKEGMSEPVRIVEDLVPWLKDKGFEPLVEAAPARALKMPGYPRSEIAQAADLIVTLGGDGTILSVARLVCARGVPILGINMGGLGFITEAGTERLKEAMEKVLLRHCPYEERMMLKASIKRYGELISEYTVLNDVVVNKGATARICSRARKLRPRKYDNSPPETFRLYQNRFDSGRRCPSKVCDKQLRNPPRRQPFTVPDRVQDRLRLLDIEPGIKFSDIRVVIIR